MKVQFTATIEMEMPDELTSSEDQQDYAENCIYYSQPYDCEEQQICVFSVGDFEICQ